MKTNTDMNKPCQNCSSQQFCAEWQKPYQGNYCTAVLKNEGKVNQVYSKAKSLAEEHYKSSNVSRDSLWNLIVPLLENAKWQYEMEFYRLFVEEGQEENTFCVTMQMEYEYMPSSCVIFTRHFLLGNYESK